ncbi:MAG: LysM peptidoglycan-binding domain-containing protein, partial [Alphaproteobacteria bacterium]
MSRVSAIILAAIVFPGLAACGSQAPAPLVIGATEPEPAAVADDNPPLPAAKPGTSLGGTVVVQAGDTVYAIARRSGVSMRGLIELNGLAPPYTLNIGQTLRLPEEYLHEVVPGDTLTAIARRFGVSMRSLAQLNGLAEPYVVKIGQRLVIPLPGPLPGQGVAAVAAGAQVPAAPAEAAGQATTSSATAIEATAEPAAEP